ncbi:unnamed protein product [Coregonus sp. 'balchen']|nr:unnamed protein product [Coregonus sp. 'balchen']
METVSRLDSTPGGKRGPPAWDTETDSTREIKTHFRVCRFIMETGVKLGMRSVPVATACVLYHQFFQCVSVTVYEPYLVAMSCIYLAGKAVGMAQRTTLYSTLRLAGCDAARQYALDGAPVEHCEALGDRPHFFSLLRYFHSSSEPLACDGAFWDLRDSVVQCELLVLRQLNFHVSFQHPHKYLLHYLLSVKSLVNRHAWSRTPVAETTWALLRDCYHGTMCVRHAPQHIAIATLYLALLSYGVEVPVGEREWWQVVLVFSLLSLVLCEDVTKEHIDAIISDLLQLYDMEARYYSLQHRATASFLSVPSIRPAVIHIRSELTPTPDQPAPIRHERAAQSERSLQSHRSRQESNRQSQKGDDDRGSESRHFTLLRSDPRLPQDQLDERTLFFAQLLALQGLPLLTFPSATPNLPLSHS